MSQKPRKEIAMNTAVIRRYTSHFLLFLPAIISLSGCSSSSGSSSASTQLSDVNQHLVYEHSLGDTTIKPHHTAVLNLPSIADGVETGYHEVAYEILNSGSYKFCVPDDDSHIDRIELYDSDNNEAGIWNQGEVCSSKRLTPGKYKMHVHHATTGDDPLIFFMPHAVTQIPITARVVAKSTPYADNIPANQIYSVATQLNDGTFKSLSISANNLTDYEYEHHIIISAKKCDGCDLRGFKLSPGVKFPRLISLNLSNSNMTNADFSNPDFPGSVITIGSGKFSNAVFAKANLSNISFTNAILDGADFSGAVLNNTSFAIVGNLSPYVYFYNACPVFDNADLSGLKGNFDALFPITTDNQSFSPTGGSSKLVDGWWETGCRVSMKNTKIPAKLFTDTNHKLWQFINAPGVDFSNQALDNAAFTGSDLTGANFTGASLQNASFVNANLSNTIFNGANLSGAKLNGITDMTVITAANKASILTGTRFGGAILNNASLANCSLGGTIWYPETYANWDGKKIDFPTTSLSNAYLFNTNFYGADLSSVNMYQVTWYGDNATGETAVFANTSFDSAFLPGLKLKNAHLQGANFINALLMNADLSTSSDRTFVNTSFARSNLKGANLSGANLNGATLDRALISTTSDNNSTYVKVAADPTAFSNHFEYIVQPDNATIAPASTAGAINCPDGNSPQSNGCGDMSGNRWKVSGSTIISNCTYTNDPNITKNYSQDYIDALGYVYICE
jgi:uncharacterized protein YjbI with pentapeptide repeats